MTGLRSTPQVPLVPFGRDEIAEARQLLTPDSTGSVSFVDLATWFFIHGDAVLNLAEKALDE